MSLLIRGGTVVTADQTYRADVPGTWEPGHAREAAPSLDAFAAEVAQEVPCVENARVGTGG